MARIDVKNIPDDTLKKLDEQCKKYGIKNRSEYIRLLINLDIMTDIVEIVKQKKVEK